MLGVNLSPEFVNLYFPYAGWGLVFSLVPEAFRIPIGTCGSGRKNNVVLNMHAQLQISLLMRFLSLLH